VLSIGFGRNYCDRPLRAIRCEVLASDLTIVIIVYGCSFSVDQREADGGGSEH
jgi:hypothetical protein